MGFLVRALRDEILTVGKPVWTLPYGLSRADSTYGIPTVGDRVADFPLRASG